MASPNVNNLKVLPPVFSSTRTAQLVPPNFVLSTINSLDAGAYGGAGAAGTAGTAGTSAATTAAAAGSPFSVAPATSTAVAPTSPTGQAQNANTMMAQVMQLMMMMLQMMVQLLGGRNATAAATGTGGAGSSASPYDPAGSLVRRASGMSAPGAAGAAVNAGAAGSSTGNVVANNGVALDVNQTSQALDRLIVGGTPQQRAQMKQNLMAMSQDPEGSKLVASSIRRGVTFAVGDPASALNGARDASGTGVQACDCSDCKTTAADGGVIVHGVTISQGDRSQIIVRDPNNLKTLAHEMIHANTTGDGNSQREEGLANVIGRRIESRLSGVALENPNATFNNTLPNYVGLQGRNNIDASLAALGLQGFLA